MPTEPSKADPPKRQRRWYQFSLRTLLIGVTLLAVACWAVVDRQRLIRERDDALLRATNAEGEAKERLQIQQLYQQSERALFARMKGLEEKLQTRSNDSQDQP